MTDKKIRKGNYVDIIKIGDDYCQIEINYCIYQEVLKSRLEKEK